jgi:hypothetical protein
MTTQSTYIYDVFISYSHADRAWVWNWLLPRLEASGLKVCIDDRDFEVGVPSLINMERAVDNSKHTLIVMTPAWIESAWTEFESLLVATNDPAARQRRLLPLKLISCHPPPRIAILTYANFTQPRHRVKEFNRLRGQIRHPSTAPMPSSVEFPSFVAGLPITHPRHFFGSLDTSVY